MREAILREGPRVRRAVLLGLVILIPLCVLRTSSDPINVPKLGLLIAGVSIVGSIKMAELLQHRDGSGLRLVVVPAAALSLPLAASWIFSPYKGWALWGAYPRMLGLLPYLCVVAFGVLLVDAFRGEPMSIARAIVIAGGVAGAYAAVQFLGLDPFHWSVKGTGADRLVVSTLGNPNFAGAFFAIVLPVAVAVCLRYPERRTSSCIATGFVLIGWAVAESQAAWAAGIAGLAILAGLASTERWGFARRVGGLALVAVTVAVVGSVVAGMLGIGEGVIPGTIQRRGEWWRGALAMSAQSPIVGRGPNAFALEHPQYRTLEDARQVGIDITDDPHSVPLSFLTSAGVLGAIGYLIAIGWVIKTAHDTRTDDLLAVAFLGAVSAYFVQSLVSIDTVALRTAGWTALAGFVAASVPIPKVAAISRSKKRKAREEPVRGLPIIASLVLVGLTGIVAGTQLILKDVSYRRAGDLLQRGEGGPALAAFEASISFYGNVHYRRGYGNVLGEIARSAGQDGEPFIKRSRQAFDFVHELPHASSTLDYARTMRDWAAIEPSVSEEVVEAYELAVTYDPIDPVLLSEASSVLLELEAEDSVVTMLTPLVQRLDDSRLWGNLALALAHEGDEEAAEQAAERALTLDPTNPTAHDAQRFLEDMSPRGN